MKTYIVFILELNFCRNHKLLQPFKTNLLICINSLNVMPLKQVIFSLEIWLKETFSLENSENLQAN